MKSSFKLVPLKLSRQAGFSLIEILIALTILGLAGAFVAGKVFDSLSEGQVKSARIQMGNLSERLKEFRRKCGFYPTSDQGLEALVKKPSGRDCKDYPPSGFIDGDKVPQDSWNEDFLYESDGNNFNICSKGGDRADGGEGGDADICLNEKKGASSAAPAEGAQAQ